MNLKRIKCNFLGHKPSKEGKYYDKLGNYFYKWKCEHCSVLLGLPNMSEKLLKTIPMPEEITQKQASELLEYATNSELKTMKGIANTVNSILEKDPVCIELQPGECERYGSCAKCPYLRKR
ncbi:MAG: hypothetical protein JEY96_01620 [Bacteroidales bacterium]|nr:hypothetical protein [Bacteroidales bacterium]